jgi:hypothetical protein
VQAEHLDAAIAPDERQQHGEEQERDLDDQSPSEAEQRDATDHGSQHDHPGEHAERPELLLRRGHDGEDEQHRRQQLALRGDAVERALLVHQQVAM